LREARDLVAQSILDMRTLLFDLSPAALYELGLEPAVECLLDRIQAAHRLATRFRTDNRPKPMTSDVRFVLFRGVREVLQNVVKHAQARSVGVSVGRDGETVLVEVQDDGVGFDAEKTLSIHDAGRGFGLFDVRERIDYLGGSLTIQSKPGKGTTATLRAPLVPGKACPGEMSHGDSSASG
jgi:signal transduction histidine kinase